MGTLFSRSKQCDEPKLAKREGLDEIDSGIFIGNAWAGQKVVLEDDKEYRELKITHVLDVSSRIHYE